MESNHYPIRKAELRDISRLTEIYNQAENAGYRSSDARNFESHKNERYPFFVYEVDEEVVGYASISPYKEEADTLNEAVEVRFYVDFSYHGFGIAKKLVSHTLQAAKRLGYTAIIAIVSGSNREGVSLLKRFNFLECDLLPSLGKVKGKYDSHLRYELKL